MKLYRFKITLIGAALAFSLVSSSSYALWKTCWDHHTSTQVHHLDGYNGPDRSCRNDGSGFKACHAETTVGVVKSHNQGWSWNTRHCKWSLFHPRHKPL